MVNRDRIEAFVSGCLTVLGFNAAKLLFFEITARSSMRIILFTYYMFVSMFFPLGICLFLGKKRIVPIIKLFLWIAILIVGIVLVCISFHLMNWNYQYPGWTIAAEAANLFGLIVLQMILYRCQRAVKTSQ